MPSEPDLPPAFDDLSAPAGASRVALGQRIVRLAAYGVIRRADRVLLFRITPGYPGEGFWTLPGGGLDFGEAPEDGAVREVEEETGLVARITGSPTILSNTGTWPREPAVPFHQIRFVYPMEVVGGAGRVEVGGSTDAFDWFDGPGLAAIRTVNLVEVALGFAPRGGEPQPVPTEEQAAELTS